MTQSEHTKTGTGLAAHHTLDRLTARALGGVRQGNLRPPTDAAKDRLYRRMFPDEICKGSLSHADTQART